MDKMGKTGNSLRFRIDFYSKYHMNNDGLKNSYI
jgi:hypothetical protein